MEDVEVQEVKTVECTHCHTTVPTSETTECLVSGDDHVLCDVCYGSTYICDHCGDRIFDSDVRGQDITLCDHCYENYFVDCASCGNTIRENSANWSDDNPYCGSCYEELGEELGEDSDSIHSYDYKPDAIFHGEEFSGPYMGIELETDGGTHGMDKLFDVFGGDEKYIYAKHDGSLSSKGIEFVSHPAKLEYHMNQPWEKLMSALKDSGYTSHDNGDCGLHIHISRKFLGKDGPDRLIFLVERYRDEIIAFSRRTQFGLERWARFYLSNDDHKKLPIKPAPHVDNSEEIAKLESELKVLEGEISHIRFIEDRLLTVFNGNDLEILSRIYKISLFDSSELDSEWRRFLANLHGKFEYDGRVIEDKRYGILDKIEELKNGHKTLRQTISSLDKCGKYHAVNLEPYHTVELRFFRGTLRHSTFIASLQLADNLARIAAGNEDIEEVSWEDIIAYGNHAEIATYWESRRDKVVRTVNMEESEEDESGDIDFAESLNRAARLTEREILGSGHHVIHLTHQVTTDTSTVCPF